MENVKANILAFCVVCAAGSALADSQVFNTPQDSLDTIIDALKNENRDQLLAVFGPDGEDIILSGDDSEDSRNRRKFLEMYEEGFRFVPQEDGSLVLALGTDGWEFPIPLVHNDAGWSFDIEAGRIEVANREIGFNEMDVLTLLQAYGDVQAEFRLVDQDGDGVMEFARSIISQTDTHDGLYWPGDDSPIGETMARASLDGFSDGSTDHAPLPFEGYFFRILTGQSDKAPGGQTDYMINGNMLAGHAILAVPAEYGVSGVHSFMVSENGHILEADLGEDSLAKAKNILLFDPSEDWTPAN